MRARDQDERSRRSDFFCASDCRSAVLGNHPSETKSAMDTSMGSMAKLESELYGESPAPTGPMGSICQRFSPARCIQSQNLRAAGPKSPTPVVPSAQGSEVGCRRTPAVRSSKSGWIRCGMIRAWIEGRPPQRFLAGRSLGECRWQGRRPCAIRHRWVPRPWPDLRWHSASRGDDWHCLHEQTP